MLERKVSGKAAEIASQPSEPKVFDTPEQVIEQGTNMIMNTVDKAANEFIDQAKGPAAMALTAGGAGLAGEKLFKGILEDDSLEL